MSRAGDNNKIALGRSTLAISLPFEAGNVAAAATRWPPAETP
jgi:hypothetical protein